MQNQTPPVNIEAEMIVLGSILQIDGGTEAVETVRPILKPQDFYKTYHRRIYEAILETHDSGAMIADLTAKPYQKLYENIPKAGKIPMPMYLEDLRDRTPSAANAEHYADQVMEAARLRELTRVLHTVESKAYEMEATSAELMGQIQDAISGNQVLASAMGNIPTARDDWPALSEQLCRSQKSKFLGLRTGFDSLDAATLGLRGLSVLGGIPGQGKSSLALQLSTQIAAINHIPVLFYALEMSKWDIYTKILSRLSKLDYTTLSIGSEIDGRRGNGLTKEHSENLNKARDEFMKYAHMVKVIDRSVCKDISLPVTRLHIQQAMREFQCDQAFVVIDHLQIFPCNRPELDDMKSRLDYLVAEFKAISEQLDTTIMLISEKNRESYNRPVLSAFMGSAGIEYGVDVAMLLHEESEEDKKNSDLFVNDEDDHRIIELRIVKNRFGIRRKITMTFHPDISKFTEN